MSVVGVWFWLVFEKTLLTPQRWHSLAWTLLDPVATVRTRFMREVCRNLEEAGGISGGAGAAGSLRFMAYLSLVATEVKS